jgi:hypothetical protein
MLLNLHHCTPSVQTAGPSSTSKNSITETCSLAFISKLSFREEIFIIRYNIDIHSTSPVVKNKIESIVPSQTTLTLSVSAETKRIRLERYT